MTATLAIIYLVLVFVHWCAVGMMNRGEAPKVFVALSAVTALLVGVVLAVVVIAT